MRQSNEMERLMSNALKILVVDAEAAHCARLIAEAAAYVEPIEIVVATAAEVAELLAHTAIDGVVLDIDLDEDAAAQVIGEVERRFAGVPLVATAGRIDDARVAAACHLGAAAILAKPFNIAALVQMLRAPASDAGFMGSCAGIPTAQLLTLHCGAGHDGVLHLRVGETATRPERTGSLFLEAGQPVHAVAGALVGADAVHTMLGWRDAEATWVTGITRCARTIVGRWEGLLAGAVRRGGDPQDLDRLVAVAHPEVVEKLARLAQTPDVLGAFLLRHAEIITGRCVASLDEQLAGRALCRLAHVFFDVEAQPNAGANGEIQAIIGDVRLVLDRIGPPGAGFQVGVVVRQAAPVCKSLRRLLRQIDNAFDRAMPARERARHDDRPVPRHPDRVSAVA
jgi:CheY-like chemotaxis protein